MKHGRKVLLRLYGGKLLETNSFLRSGGGYDREVLVFYTMSEKGIAAKLLGVFDGGRLEEYVNGHTLTCEECRDPELMAAFARILAKVHVTRLPFSKKPIEMIPIIEDLINKHWGKYMEGMKERPLSDGPEMKAIADMVHNFDVHAYIQWLKETFPKIPKKMVLRHGDMNTGNVMIRDEVSDMDKKIVLLDYEFTCYSYRGIDIGNHFTSRAIDLNAFITQGQLVMHPYTSENDRRAFAKAYIDGLKQQPDYEFDESLDNEYAVLLEAEFFSGLYDLFLHSWLISEQDKFHAMFVNHPVHPIFFAARLVNNVERSKASTIDLIERGKLE